MNIQWKAQYNAYVSAVLHYKTIIIVYKLPWLLCIVLLWLYSSWTFCFRYFHVAILKTVNLFNYANFCNGMSTLDISLNANCRQHKYRIVLFRESYIETLIHLSKSNKFFGMALLVTLSLQFPMNCISVLLYFTVENILMKYMLLCVIMFQLVFILGLHLMAAKLLIYQGFFYFSLI